MQFEYTHKAGSGIYTIKFIEPVKVKSTAEDVLITTLYRLGGKLVGKATWEFSFPISLHVIKEIIRNTCFVCGGLMKDSTALDNTIVSFNDFGNDAGQRGSTQSKTGEAVIKKVRKCSSCGHSHT